MFLAFSIAGLAVMYSNFNVAAAEEEEEAPVVTYWLGEEGATKKDENGNDIIYSESMAGGWAAAVRAATENYPALVKVKLLKNWEATSDSFGSTPTNPENHPESFRNGSIYLPDNANILLDLNGKTINRGLGTAKGGGHVFYIQGKLTVDDSNDGGKITGGFISAYSDATGNVYGGGAAYIYGSTAELNLKSGMITENKASGTNVMGGAVFISGGTFNMYNGVLTQNAATATSAVYGGAVCMYNSGTFNMYNGIISENINTAGASKHIYGGAVCMYNGGTFNMHNGIIEKNNATVGGGVASFSVNGTAINMYGGIIRNNTASIDVNTAHGGGGIGVQQGNAKTTNVYLNGGEICNNSSTKYGGGVFVWAKNGTTNTTGLINLYINGTDIHDNLVATTKFDAVGGGVAIYKASSTYNNININAKMTSGKIYNNRIVANPFKDKLAFGAGVFVSNATFELDCEDGKESSIYDNTAYSFPEGATDSTDLSNITVSGYGGGIAVEGTINNPDESHTIASKLIIKGGTIKNNKVGNSGGGIYLVGTFVYKDPEKKQFDAENSIYSKLELSGGEISGNVGKYGGGLYVTGTSKIELSGKPVVKDNKNILTSADGESADCNLQIAASDERVPIIGAFEDGALIHVSVNTTIVNNGTAFTQGYGEKNRTFISFDGTDEPDNEDNPQNGVWAYANPYRYFVSDTVFAANGSEVKTDVLIDQHIMVLANGELGISGKSIKFVVTYSDTDKEEFIFGDQTAVENSKWNYTSCTYNDARFPKTITAYVGEQQVGETITVENKAGVYTLEVAPDGVSTKTAFHVVVQAKALTTADVGIEISNDNFKFTNEQKIPSSVTVKLDGVVLVEHEDYELSYENNVNAGNKATVIVTFKGNYFGEARVYFTISSAENYEADVKVAWEINKDGEWATFAEGEYDGTFTYNEANQGSKIRAKITVTDDGKVYTNTVYVKGYTASDDDLQNINVYLVFKVNGKETEFENTGEYSITIDGVFNYQIPTDINTIEGIVMAALELDLTNDGLTNANYVDASDARLWLLKIGTDDAAYSTLLDKAIYVDPDGEENDFGEKITTGTTPDSYARFRDKDLSIILNVNYVIAGKPLSYWLERAATVTLKTNGVENGTVLGAKDVVTTVTTVVTITFGDNYVINGGNTIEITKIWKIVTISNTLRYASGTRAEVEENELRGWTFGVSTNVSYAFRPEHGDTVFYTYYLGETFVDRFALVYSDDTADAIRSFYAAKVVDGEYVVDYENPYNDPSYLSNFHYYQLKAGDYRLEVYVPEREPYTEEHHHWWDGTTANDNGTMYYEFTYVFTFTVEQYDLVTEDGELNEGIDVTFPEDGFVYYTGEENNVVEPVIYLNGILLVRGVDYELYSTSIEATDGEKTASLIIKGINSLKGQQFEWKQAFEIRQAFNGWKNIPSIMRWTYYGYLNEVHLFSGEANFGDVWFAIADADGNVIEGLDHITIDSEGHVKETSAQTILKALNAGYYKLLAHVTETANYAGLDTDAITFQVFKATNSWETTPSVNAWIQGEYVSPEENLLVKPVFGEVHVKIVGSDGKVYYDTDKGIDNLAEAKHGFYTLTAWVEGSDNFSELYEYRFDFEIFKQPGLPWWATLLIAVGALALAALILFILWKKGVFQILTEKLTVAIRTRASVEATIASVRAAKMMEEGRQSVAEAKRRERLEQLRKKAQEEREMSPEERAAKLEAKAQADAEKAEKLRKRSESAQRRAEKVRSQSGNTAEGADETSKPETPTEE